MATQNTRIRFMNNNFGELITPSVDFSSELSSFPVVNVTNKFRSKVWKPSGYFKITADSNDKLYINDGADKTVTITAGEYTTPGALATQIQTDLNTASSNWTVTYDDVTTTTYKFTISNTGSVDLRFSQTTSSIWDDIGFTGTVDTTGTTFEADEQRNHMYEYVRFDLGYNAEMTFFAAIAPLDEVFSIPESASTIKLMANNLDIWDSPPLTITLDRTDNGIFKFMDDLDDTAYRYWRFEFVDKFNPSGPSATSLGHIYIGDYITLTERNISKGYTRQYTDPSIVSTSVSGARYFDQKTKYQTWGNGSIQYVNKDDRLTLEQMFHDFGKTIPFYVSFDPTTCFTDNVDELTKYVFFRNEPLLTQVRNNTYTITNMNFIEAI
jgi:hypothetical protein